MKFSQVVSTLALAMSPVLGQSMAGPGAGAGAGNGNGTGQDLNPSGSLPSPSGGASSGGSEEAPSPGTDSTTAFGLITVRSGNSTVHQKTVHSYIDGSIGIDSDKGDEFQGHLAVGPNHITNANKMAPKNQVLTITEDHHLQFKQVEDLKDATQDWSTNQFLSWNGQQYAMVCPNDEYKIVWADENFDCEGGIGVQLMVQTMAV